MNRLKLATSVATVILFSLLNTQAFAASSCKGLSSSACSDNTQCHWVDGYKRKDGKAVSAHCRTKPKRSKSVKSKLIKDVATKK